MRSLMLKNKKLSRVSVCHIMTLDSNSSGTQPAWGTAGRRGVWGLVGNTRGGVERTYPREERALGLEFG